jgi:hypothetical protein
MEYLHTDQSTMANMKPSRRVSANLNHEHTFNHQHCKQHIHEWYYQQPAIFQILQTTTTSAL